MKRPAIYLDANAGAPTCPEVLKVISTLFAKEEFKLFANPSSIHSHGKEVKSWTTQVREQVARSLGPQVSPSDIVFTSSGTEANHYVIRHVLESQIQAGKKPHWITTPVEHDSNFQMVHWLKSWGGSVSFLPVNQDGCPKIEALEQLWTSETALVSVIWANNETGVLTDIEKLGHTVNKLRGLLHFDAAQAWGKVPIDAYATRAHFMSFSGHKIGGLPGTGMVWVHPKIHGGQEKQKYHEHRGTENVLGLVAMGIAAEQMVPQKWTQRIQPLRNRLESFLLEKISGVFINGRGAPRIANTTNISFEGCDSSLVEALDLKGFSVSAGAACSSGVPKPSRILLALGRSEALARSSIRISLPATTQWEELEQFALTLETVVKRLRYETRESLDRPERRVS